MSSPSEPPKTPPAEPTLSESLLSEPTIELVPESPAPDEIPRQLVFSCCEEVGLDPYRDFDEVLDAVHNPPARECCESACDPCILTIERAAALVRYRLPK